MDRRDFFLKVAKASGVVIPSWGLLPLAAYGQQTAAPKILVYMHFDGGPVSDYFVDPSAEPRYNLYTQQGLAIPGKRQASLGSDWPQHSVLQQVPRPVPGRKRNQHVVE